MKKITSSDLKRSVLINSYKAGACHIGSALSCVEILLEIFRKKKEKDIFLFGKASGVCAYYCLLAELGKIPKSKVAYYLKNYPLASKEVPEVIHSVGSLGHGLPVVVGLAYADRSRDVYVLMSDGECEEGTTWESVLFAAHHKLGNLKVYIDYNKLQACDKIENVCGIVSKLDLANRFSSFGCLIMNLENKRHGIYCNRYEYYTGGTKTLFRCDCKLDKHPQVWICETIKGSGWEGMENKVESHYCNITKEQIENVL